MTLRQALSAIEAKGLIDRRRGRFGGNFVATPRFEFDHAGLPGFTEQMRRIHVEAGAQVLRATTRRADGDVRHRLELKRGQQVHEVLRARLANGEPIVLEETYFPAEIFPGLLTATLTGSLYAVMREYGAAPFTADEHIEATVAGDQEAEILQVDPGFPLLLITRTSYTESGVPVGFPRPPPLRPQPHPDQVAGGQRQPGPRRHLSGVVTPGPPRQGLRYQVGDSAGTTVGAISRSCGLGSLLTATQGIPAARAASTPGTESSNTRMSPGSRCSSLAAVR